MTGGGLSLVSFVTLGAGRGVTMFDTADTALIARHRWFLQTREGRGKYAVAHVRDKDGRRTTLPMHRLLVTGAAEVDHENRNGLDNRRENLRAATRGQNRANIPRLSNNRSGFKGVSAKRGRWRAMLANRELGLFATREAAARAYDAAALEKYGQFALLNLPNEQPERK